eukprot:1072088-Amphidinium_carterae.1
MEQIRHARGHENYVPTASDWSLLEELRRNPERAIAESADARELPPTGVPSAEDAEQDMLIEDGLGD